MWHDACLCMILIYNLHWSMLTYEDLSAYVNWVVIIDQCLGVSCLHLSCNLLLSTYGQVCPAYTYNQYIHTLQYNTIQKFPTTFTPSISSNAPDWLSSRFSHLTTHDPFPLSSAWSIYVQPMTSFFSKLGEKPVTLEGTWRYWSVKPILRLMPSNPLLFGSVLSRSNEKGCD